MDYNKAKKLREQWGNKPCSHPHLERETHLAPGFVQEKTGDWVCTQCGEDFTEEEAKQIINARRESNEN